MVMSRGIAGNTEMGRQMRLQGRAAIIEQICLPGLAGRIVIGESLGEVKRSVNAHLDARLFLDFTVQGDLDSLALFDGPAWHRPSAVGW